MNSGLSEDAKNFGIEGVKNDSRKFPTSSPTLKLKPVPTTRKHTAVTRV